MYHSYLEKACGDGILAAVLLKKHLGWDKDIKLVPHMYIAQGVPIPDGFYDPETITGTVHFVDTMPEKMPVNAEVGLVIDHHEPRDDVMRAYEAVAKSVFHDNTRCASKIVFDMLSDEDEWLSDLVNMEQKLEYDIYDENRLENMKALDLLSPSHPRPGESFSEYIYREYLVSDLFPIFDLFEPMADLKPVELMGSVIYIEADKLVPRADIMKLVNNHHATYLLIRYPKGLSFRSIYGTHLMQHITDLKEKYGVNGGGRAQMGGIQGDPELFDELVDAFTKLVVRELFISVAVQGL